MSILADLAVIIPLAPGEEAWHELIKDLESLPAGCEVIFVAAEGDAASVAVPPARFREFSAASSRRGVRCRWMRASRGRARQMNAAAADTSKSFLWFLHADTRLTPDTVPALERALVDRPGGLIYFDLGFLPPKPLRMLINTRGVWVRSHWMGMPFGDQALCLSRNDFQRLGGYPEGEPYGEDHLLVWKARREGMRLVCAGARVLTSSRKYRDQGWTHVTIETGYLAFKQAIPQWLMLQASRFAGVGRKVRKWSQKAPSRFS